MKQFRLIIAVQFLFFSVNAQPSTDTALIKTNIEAAAQKMGDLFIAKDYNAYIKYIHPNIIKQQGGNAKMKATLLKTIQEMEESDLMFNKISFGDITKVVMKGISYQAVIPQILDLKTEKGILKVTSYLVAFSNDKGKTWYFIDTAGKTLQQLKANFPSLSNALVIPATVKPVLVQE